ncbi:SGNH/GDSL hydrolase family protein [Oryzibacter oryziterrae]|uniref:SGNH/GDSL hydrolase family protein n=1 Tax=Oryzibacter oryziterrae TaxID=2766474 RepID=UPI001F1FC7EE|nr:SGNH/GDSL hydrolase family protein [Oryzibacter oryziterrae]
MKIHANSKLLMIGDSITDWSRAKPIGEALFDSLGTGYVGLINAHLNAVHAKARIRVVNMGVSGDTVRDLEARWSTDVEALKPDWLSIMIGVNDVWRQFDARLQTEKHVLIGEYEETLERLIARTLPSLKGLILMTPYFVEPNTADPMRILIDQYGAVVRKLADKHGAIFVDTQAAFDAITGDIHPMGIATDRIHPTLTGHTILTRAFLKAIDAEG